MATTTRERPILFSGPMVRAILDGRKTQTRRVVKGMALDWLAPDMFSPEYVARADNDLCPFGRVGDRLWVRETWAQCSKAGGHYVYAADGDGIGTCHVAGGRWRPSIHMPRAACRLTLEITGVRVERLRDISSTDAAAEGMDIHDPSAPRFRDLWDSLNAARGYGWDANPWVWVLTFHPLSTTTTTADGGEA